MAIDVASIPKYADLPIRPGAPNGSAWGVFGDDDEVGTINFLTPERVRAASGLVRQGKVFSLNWSLLMPSPPLFGRTAVKHGLGVFQDGVTMGAQPAAALINADRFFQINLAAFQPRDNALKLAQRLFKA